MSERGDTVHLRRDLISAYLLSGSRIASWLVVLAIVYRLLGAGAFAALLTVRATVGIVQYLSLGLTPAFIRALAQADARQPRPQNVNDELMLSYAPAADDRAVVFKTCALLCGLAGATVMLGALAIRQFAPAILAIDDAAYASVQWLFYAFAIGFAFRLMSDASSAMLQTRGFIALDNGVQIAGEWLWALGCIGAALGGWISADRGMQSLNVIGTAYVLAMLFTMMGRHFAVAWLRLAVDRGRVDWAMAVQLCLQGGLLLLAQLADYFYAPINYLLSNRFLGTEVTAAYGTAIQVDAGMMVLVGAIGATLLPYTAVAHTAGRMDAVWRYYVRGTLMSLAVLTAAAIVICLISPGLFRLWLNDDMPAARAILPWVLVHTVVGGSAVVGRAVLLGMGRNGMYTVTALAAGVLNVILCYVFIRYAQMGVHGIVLATIISVTLRCGVWMPLYIRWQLHQQRRMEKQAGARGFDVMS